MSLPKPIALSRDEIAAELHSAQGWSEVGGQIARTYQFKDFLSSMRFVNRVAEYSEKVQHHPDILIRWNKVTLSVNTHDAKPGGAITSKDFDLARNADALAGA